ncbi:putative F-box/LRR-repeat protein At3g28410 isoform X2 [Gossypium raimondii]|uniref:putative F-box/LRR-repeat protein At3g28410 isoform X2 n=1 Tax=Gossypium raimondii TaxID=29730 RepID=UPI00063AF887|nr:putative F-box/LRR-repeat protein At3g28410 isoform X2 [Gossypium raimondii]
MENMELHQLIKVKVEGEENRRDETSRLNDDILIRILGFLSFKEAVRSSAISRRWQHLWKYFSGCLSFKQTKPRLASWNLNVRTRAEIAETYKDSKAYVDEWVGIALQKKTKKLQLNFGPEYYSDVRWSSVDASRVAARCYCLTKETFSSALSGIHFLTCLSVKFVGVSDEMLEHIVSICPLLESLELDHSPQLTHPKVSALRLKHLNICHCEYFIESIEIYAPNLVSFDYTGKEIPLHIKYAPKLNQVCYDDGSRSAIQHLSIHLANYLPQLVTLSIGMSVVGVVNNFPKLTSLKHLRCDALTSDGNSLRCLTSLIEASPFLHKFVLEVSHGTGEIIKKIHPSEVRVMCRSVSGHPHEYIKEVEIVGFCGNKAEAEILTYLLKNAVMLETIRIEISGGTPKKNYAYPEEIKQMTNYMINHLIQNRSPPQLLFLLL